MCCAGDDTALIMAKMASIAGGHFKGNKAARLQICKKLMRTFLTASLVSASVPAELIDIKTTVANPTMTPTTPKPSKTRLAVDSGQILQRARPWRLKPGRQAWHSRHRTVSLIPYSLQTCAWPQSQLHISMLSVRAMSSDLSDNSSPSLKL